MPRPKSELHHDRGDECPVALLLIDVINPLDFDGAERLRERARPVVERIAAFRARCRAAGVPVVYVNDNFGKWRSDVRALVEAVRASPGREVVARLEPDERDYFVLKPKLSAFHGTTLHTLLRHLRVETVILAGLAGDRCVLFSAGDAHMRDYRVLAPEDLFASEREEFDEQAKALLERVAQADVTPSEEVDLEGLLEGEGEEEEREAKV